MKTLAAVALAAAVAAPCLAQTPATPPPPIADNSFLMEEAYNQEPGVVQHINALLRPRDGGTWSYSFTQEWPILGQRHQGSFTIPVDEGLGDIALNYRHQLGSERVALAPRFSVVLPTGDESRGSGTGEVGFQVNLPVSARVAPGVVTHWNAGVSVTPAIDQTIYNAGASAIWLARPTFNVMLEVVWVGTADAGDVVVNPGVRWAHNLGSLQIVPGISFPDARDVFFYLSFEHPFK